MSVGAVSKSVPTTDDDAQIKGGTKQAPIPHDVLEEVRGFLGDDLVSKIAKAAKPFRDVVCDRWDALVDAASILADKIALDEEIRNPTRCLLGITKNVHAKLLEDDRLTEDGELETSFWSGLDIYVTRSLHGEVGPKKIIAAIMGELKDDDRTGSLLTRLTREHLDNSIRITAECVCSMRLSRR